MLQPIVASRRDEPQDDLISVLVQAEITDEDGTHRLSDPEIYSFSILLLLAGSGTTWKQLGITLAALLARPEVLDDVRDIASCSATPSRNPCGGCRPTRCSPVG